MKSFARYLELLASVQYLHARGFVFGSEEDAFFIGSWIPAVVVIFHGVTLAFASETLMTLLGLPEFFHWMSRLAICGLTFAVFVFLQTNKQYLQELRERVRFDSTDIGVRRERTACYFVIGSLLLFPLVVFLFIMHAT